MSSQCPFLLEGLSLSHFLILLWSDVGGAELCPWKGMVLGSEGPCQVPVAGSGPA